MFYSIFSNIQLVSLRRYYQFINSNYLLFFALSSLISNISSLLIFPKYLDPIWPLHNDSYLPVQINAYSRLIDILSLPRPVFMLFTYFTGSLGIRLSLLVSYILAIAVASLFAYFWTIFVNYPLGKNNFAVFLYLLLIFSHSYWYSWANFDTSSQLSLFFTLLAVIFCIRHNYFLVLLFFSCASLSKETFFLTTPLMLLGLHFVKLINIRFSIAIFLFSIFLSVCHSIIIGSPFVSGLSKNPDSNYHIQFNFSIIYNIVNYIYVGYSFKEIFFWMCIMVLTLSLVKSKFYFAFLCQIALLGLLSLLPNSILQNHFFNGYSLNSAYFFYACVFVIPFSKNIISVRNILFLLLVIGILLSRNYSAASWYVIQQDSQRDLLKSLIFECSKLENAKKYILISGLSIPFSPFYYGGGPVQSISGCANSQFDIEQVEIVPSTPSWFRTGVRVTGIQYIYGKVSDISKYDHVWLFDDHKLVLGYAT